LRIEMILTEEDESVGPAPSRRAGVAAKGGHTHLGEMSFGSEPRSGPTGPPILDGRP